MGEAQAGDGLKEDQCIEADEQATRSPKPMMMAGTLRSNLLAAITSARRLKGTKVHKDTIDYWHRLAEYGRHNCRQPLGESVAELVAELESELALVKKLGAAR